MHNRINVSISMIIISTIIIFLGFKVFKETFILSGTVEYTIENEPYNLLYLHFIMN